MSGKDLDFPLIYCNGDSYSDPNYHPVLQNQTYAHHVGKALGAFVINNAISGSCNRRIIRSACHDLLKQRNLNPTQQIIALIGFSFEIRDEIWIDDLEQDREPQESHFRTHQFSEEVHWKKHLLDDRLIMKENQHAVNKKFLRRWSEGRAFFYSSYAERINFLLDVLMFQAVLEKHNIKYLMFQGPMAEKLEHEYLLDFFKNQIQDPRIFDFEGFSFCDWCHEHNYESLDLKAPIGSGHYGPDAHQAFALEVLLPKLKKTKQI
jgi:hypothetical protein